MHTHIPARTYKGFISLGIIIALVVIAALAGGVWWIERGRCVPPHMHVADAYGTRPAFEFYTNDATTSEISLAHESDQPVTYRLNEGPDGASILDNQAIDFKTPLPGNYSVSITATNTCGAQTTEQIFFTVVSGFSAHD